MSKRIDFCLLILVFPVASFSKGTNGGANSNMIREAENKSEVNGCKFLGNVEARSGWGNVAYKRGIRDCKRKCLEKAAELGGTHIYYLHIDGFMASSASAEVYKCDTTNLQTNKNTIEDTTNTIDRSLTNELRELFELKERGAITQNEFNRLKTRLINQKVNEQR